jgi:peroxiredoxin
MLTFDFHNRKDHPMKRLATLSLALCLLPAVFAQPRVPRPADDLRLTDSNGKPLSIRGYRGKVVLIEFLYTTCPHCQESARMFSKLQDELGARGLRVVGVAFNPEAERSAAVVGEFVKSNNINFPIGAAPQDTVLSYLGFSMMERFMVPQLVVIDREGVIRAQTDAASSSPLRDETYLRSFLGNLLAGSHSNSSRRWHTIRDRAAD